MTTITKTPAEQRAQLERTYLTYKEIEKRKCLEDMYYFFQKAYKVLEPHNALEDNWHIAYLCMIAQQVAEDIAHGRPAKHSQILINICPRSLKSFIFNIVLPVYMWVLKPSTAIITTSYALDLGLGFSRKRQALINSRWFQSTFGDLIKIERAEGGRESVQETENSERGTIYVASTGGTITGKGLLLGINDDPVKASEGSQAKALEESVTFYNESLWTRRNNPKTAVIITVMQRIAEKDLSGHLISNHADDPESLLHINLPLEQDGTEKIPYKEQFLKRYPQYKGQIYHHHFFFYNRYDLKFIREIKKRGDIFYNTQYLQNPLPTDGLVFKRDWFKTISKADFEILKRNGNLRSTHILDTAYTSKTINDPTGGLTYYTHEDLIYVSNFETDHVDSADLPEWVNRYVHRNGYTNRSTVTIEPKGSGKVVVSLIKRFFPKLNVTEYKYPTSARVNINMSKEERSYAITPMAETGRIVLVEGTWNESFLAQVTTFPLAAHDEAVDCLVMGVLRAHYIDNRYKKFGLKLAN
jgi:predicted phage terminase large subunit-like protein